MFERNIMSEGNRLTRCIMKPAKKEAAAKANEDRINQLPDAIFHLIFDNVSEAKFLLNCSLVSKRFASLIAHTRTVTVQVPYPSSSIKVREFLTSFGHFLEQFHCIETLYIQISLNDPDYPLTQDPFVKWEMEMKSRNVVQFSILSAKSFTASGEEEKEGNGNSHVKAELDAIERGAFKILAICNEFDAYNRCLYLTVSLFESKDVRVQKVVITDLEDKGKISVLQMQDSLGLEEIYKYQLISWYWYVPVLRLPTCRGVMKEVKLAIHKASWGDDDGDIVCAGDGKDGVLWEAVREIMKQEPFSVDG